MPLKRHSYEAAGKFGMNWPRWYSDRMTDVDFEPIRNALSLARERGFAEVSLEVGDMKFRAVLEPAAAKKKPRGAHLAPEHEAAAGEDVEVLAELKAGLVGFFQEARKPMVAGASIAEGDVVGVITALGIANDVEANVSGEVIEVLVNANDPVQYGQVIARVRPT